MSADKDVWVVRIHRSTPRLILLFVLCRVPFRLNAPYTSLRSAPHTAAAAPQKTVDDFVKSLPKQEGARGGAEGEAGPSGAGAAATGAGAAGAGAIITYSSMAHGEDQERYSSYYAEVRPEKQQRVS